MKYLSARKLTTGLDRLPLLSEIFHEELKTNKNWDFVFFFEKEGTTKRVDISETVKFKMLKHTSSFF